jgi:hypothetical protein
MKNGLPLPLEISTLRSKEKAPKEALRDLCSRCNTFFFESLASLVECDWSGVNPGLKYRIDFT